MPKPSGNKRKKAPFTEDKLDAWLQKTDLSRLYNPEDFHPHHFEKLEEKLIESSYQKSQKTVPVTLRLPKTIIQKLKLLAMREGIAYQTLIKIILNDRTNHMLERGHSA